MLPLSTALNPLLNTQTTRCVSVALNRFLSIKAKASLEEQQMKKEEEKFGPKKFLPTNSFVMNLFSGNIKLNQVFPFPEPLDKEQLETIQMISEANYKYFEEINDASANDANECVPDKNYQILKDIGCFGAIIPIEYDGAGLNSTQSLCLGEIAGQYDLGLSITLGVHGIGLRAIILNGTDEQKSKYLPDLASGKKIAAFALTEPGTGSDARSIKSKAVLSNDGKHYILNGSKIWISNGGFADIFTVFAKVPIKCDDTGEVKEKMTAFIVERNFGGITHSKPLKKMGLNCSNTVALYFDNVPIPVENVIGEVGGGFKVAMNVLNGGRYGMAGLLSGTMKTLIQKATNFANNRVQFGSNLASFQGIQEKLARMAMVHYIVESIAYMVAGNIDMNHKDCHLEAAIGKIYSSEAAWFVCDETVQIMGGMGYMREAGIEKIMRDLRVFRVFEGANDILRLFIALTGLQNAGNNLKEIQKAIKNPIANIGLLFDESTKRMSRVVGLKSNYNNNIAESVAPQLKECALLVSKSIEHYGSTVEYLLLKYNKAIINEQFLLLRLANSAIDIYSMIVVLSRATRSVNKQFKSAEHEINMVKVICSEAYERSENNLSSIRVKDKLKNYEIMKKIAQNVSINENISHVHPICY